MLIYILRSKLCPLFYIFALWNIVKSEHFLPGDGCGTVTPWTVVDKLPVSREALDQLQCVITDDAQGYKRWKQMQVYYEWTSWNDCSQTCGGGLKTRTRECKNGTHTLDLTDCDLTVESVTINCNVGPCPCMLFDTVYKLGSELDTLTNIESIRDCWNSCQANSNCEYWTFDKVSQTCLLLSGHSGFDYDRNAISGPRTCDPDEGLESCFQHDVSIDGNLVRTRKTGNIIKCQEVCSEDAECKYFTYLYDEKRCKMHSSIESGFITGQSLAISAAKNCRPYHSHDMDCLEYGSIMQDNFYDTATNKEIYDCPGLCEADERCNFWQYSFSSEKCFLFETPGEFNFHYRVFKGTGNCKAGVFGSCLDFHINSGDSDVDVITRGDALTCQKMCEENSDCGAWFMSGGSKNCVLKSAGQKRDWPDSFSGDKDCIPPSVINIDCAEPNTDFEGNTLDSQHNSDLADCPDHCASVSGCTAYTYSPSLRKCNAKSTDSGREIEENLVSANMGCNPVFNEIRP